MFNVDLSDSNRRVSTMASKSVYNILDVKVSVGVVFCSPLNDISVLLVVGL